MKWFAGILAALYLVWPYYTLHELSQAIKAGDASTINRRVDWERVRAGIKTQLQAAVTAPQKTPEARQFEKQNPAIATFGNTLALTFVNSMVDRILTPEGIANLVQGLHTASTTARGARPDAKAAAYERQQVSLWRRIKFAFFVSPIDFRVDLYASDRDASSAVGPALSVLLSFKGTGWQVTDVRLSNLPRGIAQAAQ